MIKFAQGMIVLLKSSVQITLAQGVIVKLVRIVKLSVIMLLQGTEIRPVQLVMIRPA